MEKDKLYILERMPVPKAILNLALPTVLSMMVQILYNLTDTFFIGKLNDAYQVAALTIALPVFMAQMALAGIFGNGGASYLSRLLGMRKLSEARETVTTALFSVAVGSIVVGGISVFMIGRILDLLGASANTYQYAYKYMRIILLGSPIVMFNFSMAQLIRAEGAARIAMYGMLIGTGLNIILDPVFIFVFNMGVTGAAVATLIGNLFAVSFYSRFYLKKISLVPPSLKFLRLRMVIFKEIFKIGIPASLSQIMMSIGSSISYKLASVYSDNNVAALGVAMRTFSLPIFIFIGISVGIQPLIGYSYGAKLFGRMRETIRVGLIIALGMAVLFLIIFALFPTAMISAFIKQEEVVQIGTMVLEADVFAIPFAAIGMIFMVSLQAWGKAFPALIVALSRQGLAYLPALVILNRLFGFQGLVFALPVADAVTVLFSSSFVYFILRKMPHQDQKGGQPLFTKQD
ncbi:MAG: MATE family efflux transporter [Candidatus Cloacimonetes bacterium]|nr:MATE family efflux transporter [Candidatus Cloacimonadota bacterium]